MESRETLTQLFQHYPNRKLLALGQTVFWDEPVKAVLCKILDELNFDNSVMAGIHDTDYFGKLPQTYPTQKEFVIAPNNDHDAKGIWSAVGEISRLFGGETVVTRDRYHKEGIPIDKIARNYPCGKEAFLNQMTEAWGWRGLVSGAQQPPIPCLLPFSKVCAYFIELLEWAFNGTYESIGDSSTLNNAMKIGNQIISEVCGIADEHPEWSVSEVFKQLLSDFYEKLLQEKPSRLEITSTSELLLLNSRTAKLPRFEVLNHFLNPASANTAKAAYNHAVSGSEIYPLDKFGEGALPFDAVLPDAGRGTLCATETALRIQTPNPITIPLDKPIACVEDLAKALEIRYPQGAVVVGKALTLVSMLSNEFIFIFHEEGSMYVNRTRTLHQTLAEHGLGLNWSPILRMGYETWSSLNSVSVWLKLPEHYQSAFGQTEICSPSFAGRWRAVVDYLSEKLSQLRKARGIRDIIHSLQDTAGGRWDMLAAEYERLLEQLNANAAQRQNERKRINALFDVIRQSKTAYVALEKEKGEHFRRELKPLLDANDDNRFADDIAKLEAYRKDYYDEQLSQLRMTIVNARKEIREIRKRRSELEKTIENTAAYEARRDIEREAHIARMRIVRDAILTMDSLTRSNHRPTAWWLMMLSPNGEWFKRLADTAHLYLEDMN